MSRSALSSLFPLLPRIRHRRQLSNGLRILAVEVPGVEVVSSCLWYRFGASHEQPGEEGGAHFLEHMMFKGSAAYGPGVVDRRTQALGGSNNAFTSQDATAYYFKFSPPHWREGLAIEADRMRGLLLDPREVTAERKVILEELSMVEADPWDALDQAMQSALYGEHPYGRPILGTRKSLANLGPETLRSLHARKYQPANAVLVLAGGVDGEVLEVATQRFGEIAPRGDGSEWTPPPRTVSSNAVTPDRIDRKRGRVARIGISLLGPSAETVDHPVLRLAMGILAAGRSSRLHRRLVEELELCQWVAADISETRGPSSISVSAELHPDADPEAVESILRMELDALVRQEVDPEDLDRVRRVLTSGWIFGHDQVHDLALSLGLGISLFDREDFVEEQLQASLHVTPDQLREVASRWLQAPGVVGRSLPEPVN